LQKSVPQTKNKLVQILQIYLSNKKKVPKNGL